MTGHSKTYNVKKLTTSLSGALNSVPWDVAEALRDFSYPWEKVQVPLLEFRGLYDVDWFYCFFNVVDQEISVYTSTDHKQEVLYGDRVEIFLTPDRSLSTYYCLEIDLRARIYDYRGSFYRKFEDTWSWPSKDIAVDAGKTATGYQVLLALRLASLRDFGLLKNNEMFAGLFRGKCSAASPSMDSMRWISWLTPDSKTPDFHIPSSFGRFLFE